jgi:hypothetical protein
MTTTDLKSPWTAVVAVRDRNHESRRLWAGKAGDVTDKKSPVVFLLFVDSFGWEARELRLLMGSYINLRVIYGLSSESAVNRKLTSVNKT